MSFNNILSKYRKISFSERDKGARFEKLMQAYLLTDPQYAYRFKKVWMCDEFPDKTQKAAAKSKEEKPEAPDPMEEILKLSKTLTTEK